MRFLTISIIFCTFILAFNSCKKKGCTSNCASNYSSAAEEDDGSCRGCTDPLADNYCSNSNGDDGSCVYPECLALEYGWLEITNCCSSELDHRIVIDGISKGDIDYNCPSYQWVNGCCAETYKLAAGQHTLVIQHSGSGSTACSQSSPFIIKCETMSLSCSI